MGGLTYKFYAGKKLAVDGGNGFGSRSFLRWA